MPAVLGFTALDLLALIAVSGWLTCLLFVAGDAEPGLAQRLRASLGGVLLLLTLASLGALVGRTLELNGGQWNRLWSDLRPALTLTHYGHIWRWRVPALMLAWLAWGWMRWRHSRRPAWLIVLAVAVIALTRSTTGHPGDEGDLRLPVWIDSAHMLAAGAWVGSLFCMTLVVFPYLRRGLPRPARAALAFQRLSTLSGAAVLVLVAAGIYSVSWQLGAPAHLWSSRYGVLLSLKLGLVALMLLLGVHNRYVRLPGLRREAGLPASRGLLTRLFARASQHGQHRRPNALPGCARAVALEALLGLAVIGVTAVFLQSMPPADMTAMSQAMHAP